MAATVRIVTYWEVSGLAAQPPLRGGVQQQPTLLPVGGTGVHDRTVQIANGASATLLDIGAGDIADFDFLSIESDQDLLLEIWGALLAANNSHVPLKKGVPLLFGNDDTQAYAAAGNFAGAAAAITKIMAKNSSGVTATLRCVAIT